MNAVAFFGKSRTSLMRICLGSVALGVALGLLGSSVGCGNAASQPPSVDPVPPVADGGQARTVFAGEVVVFDGSPSVDSDGSIESVRWQFGDGAESTDLVAMHSYAEVGGYIARLTVTDNDGLTDTAEIVVTVTEVALTASVIVNPEVANVFEPVTFDASGSVGPAEIVAWRWTFGDGAGGEGEVVEHVYETPGSFNVLLEVEDGRGDTAQLAGFVEVQPMNVGGQWQAEPGQSWYSCAEYDAHFEDTELTFTVGTDGALTATSQMGRTWEGTLDGSAFTLTASYIGETGSGCISAPVSATLTGTFTSPDSFTANAVAYYDLSVPCQCSAVFSVTGSKR
jgi:chitodextrinase